MRARLIPLWGALLLGALGGLGCSDKGPTPGTPSPGTDAGTRDGGSRPEEDAGHEPVPSPFTCEVSRQRGCDAGQSCLFRQLEDGGTGSQCFGGACDPVRQDCPDGQRCTYVRGDGGTWRECVAEGTADEGAPCQLGASEPLGIDTCKKGLFCTDVALADGGTGFQCARLCHDTASCAAPRECNEVLRLPGTVELPLICGAPSQRCDLLAQDCESPLSCYPTTDSALCASTGNLSEGATCEFSNQCARGSACVRTGEGLTCRPICRYPSGQPGCARGTCQPLQSNADAGACVP
ncbi:hypothetical protein [Hyalangium rubrum]|uniref:Lipoprotein n=1 Tax=Hyalangium rubrum TaxID=3103134 RepID=A0ABU5H8J2_9BACT|nr:hypothetical protein [Hyalangium sp. s54d21]MDY7229616.1 hypothetical protein [Hyalangium sp. s54d21]